MNFFIETKQTNDLVNFCVVKIQNPRSEMLDFRIADNSKKRCREKHLADMNGVITDLRGETSKEIMQLKKYQTALSALIKRIGTEKRVSVLCSNQQATRKNDAKQGKVEGKFSSC